MKLNSIEEIIEDIPSDETLTIYQQGDFYDLCRGPHVPSTAKLTAFKLTKPVRIIVNGEEDLLTVPACIYSPDNHMLLYGQPNEGIVSVRS